ncbi:unnamed protein product [Sympodiomycopsis kandeliae]
MSHSVLSRISHRALRHLVGANREFENSTGQSPQEFGRSEPRDKDNFSTRNFSSGNKTICPLRRKPDH